MQTRIPSRKWLLFAIPLLLIGGVFLTRNGIAEAYPVPWSLGVPSARQEQSQWCWAASIQSVMSYLGVWDSQCNIVQKVYAAPCPNQPATVSQVRQALSAYGFASTAGGALSFGTIVSETYYGNRPLIAGLVYSWGGHMVVVDGYDQDVTNYVEYMDPGDGGYYVNTYDWFRNGPGHYWAESVYQIHR